MVNYQEGKIYRLEVGQYFYIGSCCSDLQRRLVVHRGGSKRAKRDDRESKLYSLTNRVGIDEMKISLVENFPCDTKEELLLRESEIIYENIANPLCLNTKIPLQDPILRAKQRSEYRMELARQKLQQQKSSVKKISTEDIYDGR